MIILYRLCKAGDDTRLVARRARRPISTEVEQTAVGRDAGVEQYRLFAAYVLLACCPLRPLKQRKEITFAFRLAGLRVLPARVAEGAGKPEIFN